MTSLRALRFTSLMLFALVSAMSFSVVTAQEMGASLTVDLQEFEGSGITGTAVLTQITTGGTHVSMQLLGQELDGNHPTHIHTGTCDDFDPNPLYPLETVNLSPVNREGLSESDVENASIETLRSGKYVILVHQSPEELTNYLVCGEIRSGTLGVAPKTLAMEEGASAHQTDTNTLPEAGAGGAKSTTGPALVMACWALAILSALGAGALRIYDRTQSSS